MGGAIGQIASGITDQVKKGPVGAAIGGIAGGSVAGIPGMIGGAYMGGAGEELVRGGGDSPAPQAPGVDPALQKMKDQQLQYAKDFRSKIPEMQNQMGEDLKKQTNQSLSQGIHQTKQDYSNRGLLYSGMRAGAQAGQRAKAQAGLASGISGINADLNNAANTLDAQAVETGVGIQQTQQTIQNQIYANAQAKMNAQNSMIGSALGTGLLAATLMA